jgi:hypothetical protein
MQKNLMKKHVMRKNVMQSAASCPQAVIIYYCTQDASLRSA